MEDLNKLTTIIPSNELPLILVKEIKNYMQPHYPNGDAAWENEVHNSNTIRLDSLNALIAYFEQLSKYAQGITVMAIRHHLQLYGGTVIQQIVGSIESDQEILEKYSVIEKTAVQDMQFIYPNMEENIQIMRDMVTKKSGYVQTNEDMFEAKSTDLQGNVNAFAQVRKNELSIHQLSTKEETEIWLSLVAETLTSLDEWTADLFDMICFFWSSQEKDEHGYIDFHSDDALRLKYRKTVNVESFEIRERERFDIMKRVAALTNIWISLRDDKIRIISNNQQDDKQDDYDFTEYKRMFEISSVKLASDKKTGEPKGIYALTIKPAPLLMNYLSTGKYTLGVMDLKVFEYNYYRQRDHKRLARYLSYIWKARISNNTLKEPIRIHTLLEAIDLPKGYSGSEIRDRLEGVLDDLQEDGVIQEWSYKVPVDESRVGKRGWVNQYWGNLSVEILPPKRVILENKKNVVELPKIIREPESEQLYLLLEDDPSGKKKPSSNKSTLELDTLEQVLNHIKMIMKEQDLSIRQAAADIGLTHTTLIRLMNSNNIKTRKSSLDKMKKWVIQQKNK